jgi:hypothetical protein
MATLLRLLLCAIDFLASFYSTTILMSCIFPLVGAVGVLVGGSRQRMFGSVLISAEPKQRTTFKARKKHTVPIIIAIITTYCSEFPIKFICPNHLDSSVCFLISAST